MSDNEDILADDLGDHSLADYNLGNDEEDQLLADDFENAQNVPSQSYDQTLPPYEETRTVTFPPDTPRELQSETFHRQESFHEPQEAYQEADQGYAESYSNGVEGECVVPNVPVTEEAGFEENFNRYGERVFEPLRPPVLPEMPVPLVEEPPQRAPVVVASNGEASAEAGRERFPAERPAGAARTPRVRDIPDSLDKVYIPRAAHPRGDFRTTWRNPHYQPRYQPHPYRRVNPSHADFQRPPFQPPQVRPQTDFGPPGQPPQRQPFQRPPMQPPPQIQENRPPFPRPPMNPRFNSPPERFNSPPERFNSPPERFNPPPERFNPPPERFNSAPERFPPPEQFAPPNFSQPPPPGAFGLDEPNFRPQRPNFPPERPQMSYRGPPPFQRPMIPPFNRPMGPNFAPRVQLPPLREIVPNSMNHLPQVTIRQAVPLIPGLRASNLPPNMGKLDVPPPPGVGPDFPLKGPPEGFRLEQEVRMLPVQLPANIPFTGKKVLINPHFKGNIQPPIEGPVKNIDDAAERFIAEQRSALARAAQRKPPPRRSPQRYVENTTVEIENELVGRDRERELLRRQEEFISANRAGLRRRMRSPTPPRRSPTPPPRRRALTPPPSPSPRPPERAPDTSEEGEYKRRLREQESMRERVLRAKEVRRRKNAVTLQKQLQERERERERERTQAEWGQNPVRDQRQPDRPPAPPERSAEPVRDQRPPPERQDGYRDKPRDTKYYDREPRLPERDSKPPENQKPPERDQKLPEREQKLPEREQKPPERVQRPPERDQKLPDREQKPPEREQLFTEKDPIFPERVQKPLEKELRLPAKLSEREPERVQREKTPERPTVPERKAESQYLPVKVQKAPELERKTPQKLHPRADDYERDLTPPLPMPAEPRKQEVKAYEKSPSDVKTADRKDKEDMDDDALDLILDELDGILSDDEDTGRFKEKPSSTRTEPKPKQLDLRSKLPPKAERTAQRQKIVFGDDGKRDAGKAEEGKRRREKTPPKRSAAPAPSDDREPVSKLAKTSRPRPEPPKPEPESYQARQRQKIVFDKKEPVAEAEENPKAPKLLQPYSSRRVVLQRKIQPAKPIEKSVFARIEGKTEKTDPTVPTAGIFSRAVRTALNRPEKPHRIVVQRQTSEDPKVEVEMDSDSESLNEDLLLRDDDEMLLATVTNLPHGMTDTRLRTLAGADVQSLSLEKERRSAKITFKSNAAAESFKKKFNNKMVAASRLTVVLR